MPLKMRTPPMSRTHKAIPLQAIPLQRETPLRRGKDLASPPSLPPIPGTYQTTQCKPHRAMGPNHHLRQIHRRRAKRTPIIQLLLINPHRHHKQSHPQKIATQPNQTSYHQLLSPLLKLLLQSQQLNLVLLTRRLQARVIS